MWVSAFATHGLGDEILRFLLRRHGLGTFELLLGKPAKEETLRILVEKFHATEDDLIPVRTAMDIALSVPASTRNTAIHIPDPDDVPLIACALAASAELFITGDKALPNLKKVEIMAIVSPRAAWEILSKPE